MRAERTSSYGDLISLVAIATVHRLAFKLVVAGDEGRSNLVGMRFKTS